MFIRRYMAPARFVDRSDSKTGEGEGEVTISFDIEQGRCA